MKNDFSLLDLACLILAIPLTIAGAPLLEGGMSKGAKIIILAVWVFVFGLAEGLNLLWPEAFFISKIMADVVQCLVAIVLLFLSDADWQHLWILLIAIASAPWQCKNRTGILISWRLSSTWWGVEILFFEFPQPSIVNVKCVSLNTSSLHRLT